MLTVKIGEVARAAAVARTGHDPGPTIEVDFSSASAEDRAIVARYYNTSLRELAVIEASDTTPEAICAALRARAQADDARAAQEQAERERLAADAREHLRQALQLPIDDWIDGYDQARMPVPPGYYCAHYAAYQAALREAPGYRERLAEAKRLAEARAAEARAAEARAAAERERAKDEKEAAEAAYLTAWVQEYGDEALRAQYADGLLCQRELLELVADWALAGLPPAHEVITCEERGCPCGLTDVDCIPRSLYPAWRDLRATLPEGTTWEFERARDCQRDEDEDEDEDTASEPYYTALLTVPVGPFQFTRRIRLG